MSKRKRKRQSKECRKAITLRVKPESADALATLAETTEMSQGKVLDSFLKPFLKVE